VSCAKTTEPTEMQCVMLSGVHGTRSTWWHRYPTRRDTFWGVWIEKHCKE